MATPVKIIPTLYGEAARTFIFWKNGADIALEKLYEMGKAA